MLLKILLLIVLSAGAVISIYDPKYPGKPKSYHRDPHIARELHRHHRRSRHREHRPRLSAAHYEQSADVQHQERHASHVHPGRDYANNIDAHYGGCPRGFTGLLPYPYDCRRFVNCWKGRAFIQTCGPGTVFNDETMECDSPSKVVCRGIGGGTTPQPAAGDNRLARIQTDDEEQVACPPGYTGLLPHPQDCSKFLNCASGSMHIQVCGPGTMFSPQMKVCDFASKVDCTGRDGGDYNPPPPPSGNRGGKTFETAPRENQAGNWDIPQRKGWPHRRHHHHRFHPGPPPPPPPPARDFHHEENCTQAHHQHHHSSPPLPGHTPLVYRDRWSSMNRTRPDAPSSRPGWQTTKTPEQTWTRTTITSGWVPIPEANTTPQPTWQTSRTTTTGRQPAVWAPVPATTTTPRPTWQSHGSSAGTRTTTTTTRPQSNYPYPPDSTDSQTTIYYAQPVDDDVPSEEIFSDVYGGDVSEVTLPARRRNASRGVLFPAVVHSNHLEPSHPSRDAMHIPNLNLMPPHPSDDRQSPVPDQYPDYSSPYPSYAAPQPQPQPRPSYGSYNPTTVHVPTRDHNESPVSMDTVNIPSMTLMPPHRSPPSDEGQQQVPDQYPDPYPVRPTRPDSFNRTTVFISAVPNGGRPSIDAINVPHMGLTPPQEEPVDRLSPYPEPIPPLAWDSRVFNTTTFIISPTPIPDESNLYGGLLPPLPSAPQAPEVPEYAPLQPPSTPTTPYRPPSTTPQPGVKTNVRTVQIYPPPPGVQNATTRIHPSPFYSPSYSGVAHSRNTTWSSAPPIKTSVPSRATPSPRSSTTTFVPDPEIFEPEIIYSHDGGVVLPTTTQRHGIPAPNYNREFYKQTTPSPAPGEAPDTSDEDGQMPLSEAIRLLLRPYFNRSGTVTDDMATRAESHIMSLSRSKEPTTSSSTSTTTTTTSTTTTTTTTVAPELDKDVELVFAGEQNSLRPSYAHHPIHPSNSQLHPPSKYHQHHDRNFHRTHPHLPNPFETESVRPSGETTPKTLAEALPDPTVDDVCQFDCGNGNCVKTFETCDGINNCGNRKDEEVCDHLGYEIRLSEKDHGRVEVKILGQWGYVCDDKFGILDANVVCQELGFPNGASEVHGNSYYPPPDNKDVSFVMDELDCTGNETSLQECAFMGWGVSDCGADEVVGVQCRTQSLACPNDYWLCRTSQECIPPAFVCDNVADCSDQSDESAAVCNSTVEFRLKGSRSKQEGRLEVLYRGVWGTVCDDDFGQTEAQVACNSLGYFGPAKIVKNAFGPGSGPIWLDQVSCFGNESSIDGCAHWSWGEHNCNHTEDVSIRCTSGSPPRPAIKGSAQPTDDFQTTTPDDIGMDLYPMERSSKFKNSRKICGHFNPNLTDEIPREFERVVQGNVARRGHHPWQATIRTKGRGGISSHWCGAVLISKKHLLTAAHCLVGYPKGAYFIRLGDHIANIAESSEIDSFIENWYIHEKFRDGTHMNNDIAVIVMKNPVRFNDYIQPICLPQQGAEYQEGRRCTISGWGSIQSGVSTPSNNLRVAEIPVIADDVCKLPHVYGSSITEGMFCAGYLEEGVDACEGDSGGPFVCSDSDVETLYGIISWGQQCGHANKPGVYVKIEKYLDWIYEKIRFSMQQTN